MKTRSLFVFLLVGWVTCGYCQSVSNQVVAVAGFSGTNGGHLLDFTVGELAVTTVGSGPHQVTQGFHQTYTETVSLQEAGDVTLHIRVFPNPATEYVNIALTGEKTMDITAAVYDSQGKLLYTGNHPQAQLFRIDLQAFAAGTYYVRLTEKTTRTPIKTFQIQKQSFTK